MRWWIWAIVHGTNPLMNHWLWAPIGLPMLWVASVPTISFIMSPVTAILGATESYNLAMIIGSAAAAYSMYLLLELVTRRWWLQLLGGYMFGFSSYELAQTLGHLNLTWIFPIPLLVLIGILSYRHVVESTPIPLRYRVWSVILLVALFGISTEMFTTASFVALPVIVIAWVFMRFGLCVRRETHKPYQLLLKLVRWSLTNYILAGLLLSPALVYMMIRPLYNGYPNSPTFFSSDLLNYIVPTRITVGGSIFQGISRTFLGNLFEQDAYVGFAMVLLTVVTIVLSWRQQWLRIATVGLLFVFSCSFGPELHIAGHVIIPMPWAIFVHVPFLEDALPTRLTLYVNFFVIMIVVIGLDKQIDLKKWEINGVFYVLLALSVLLVIPNLSLGKGYWWSVVTKPRFFTKSRLVRSLIPRNSNVMMFPYGPAGDSIEMQRQAHFEFRLANAYMGAMPPSIGRWPVANLLWNSTNIPDGKYYSIQLAGLLASQNVRRIIAIDGVQPAVAKIVARIEWVHKIYSGLGVEVWSVSGVRTPSSDGVIETMAKDQFWQFRSLNNAAERWLNSEPGELSDLYPAFLENNDLLPSSLGAYPKSSPNWNWTSVGGWLGPWANGLYGVETTGTGAELADIVNRYRKAAIQVLFPYPRSLTEKAILSMKSLPEGLLIMTFAQPEHIYHSQFSSLLEASRKWLDRGLPLKFLSPELMEKFGFLQKTYGGRAGEWMSATRPSFFIGIDGPWERLEPIYKEYRPKAIQVFFPYPKPLGKNAPPGRTMGQLLMVFPANH